MLAAVVMLHARTHLDVITVTLVHGPEAVKDPE
jgi:hypothetical protein